MVFYRKYRPQKISELDSQSVRDSLYSIFATKDFPHAFLFSGPKGLGKTSTARIVAKVINCEKHSDVKKFDEKTIEPCNKCSECTTITNGNNFDVLEIDGASNRGIDEIRDLKEKINLLPSRASKKVYIIDEVHMLTTEAFNALLKTLEEPPIHAVFILCTTEFQKLPQTIVSRCFRVDFKKATNEEIARSLKRIVKAEDIKIEDDSLLEIANLSGGSFRDSAKILEEVSLSAGRKTITPKLIEEKYNTLGIDKSVEDFIEALSQKDGKKGFEITQKLFDQSMDFKFFIEKLMDRFHFMLLAKMGVGEDQQKFELNEIKNILNILSKAYMETKYSVLPQLPLELAIVEWVNLSTPIRIEKDSLAEAATSKAPVNPVDKPATKPTPSSATVLSNGDFSADFINEVKNHNHLLAGVLRSCEIENVKEGKLNISAISKFHKQKLEEDKSMLILKSVGEKLSGQELLISITLRG